MGKKNGGGQPARLQRCIALSLAVAAWLTMPVYADGERVMTRDIIVQATPAEEAAKTESQQTTIITSKEIEKKQAKSVEDVIFNETGVSRTVDAMGRVGVSIRGAEPRHTLILVDGQRVMGDFDKYSGAADEVMRLGTENVDHIEIVQGAASAKYGSDAIGGVINVITKKAKKKPSIQINAEGSRRKGDGDIAPFQNVFLRADSGQLGKLRLSLSGSKRDIMPVLASERRRISGMGFDYGHRDFAPNVLRYYGTAADIGLLGTYEFNKDNSLEFRVNRYTEDLLRDVKHSDSDLEPQQHFKRTADRNTLNLSWKRKTKKTDWIVEGNYTRIKEDDVALINYTGRSVYEGSNELRYIDDVDHRQYDIKVAANTQINDKHLLSYGAGYSHETGEGSRLKSSPHTHTKYIDAWDYDKNLLVDKLDRMVRKDGDTSTKVFSHIHDYKFDGSDPSGMPQWDINYEYYGEEKGNVATVVPLKYDDYTHYQLDKKQMMKQDWSGNWVIETDWATGKVKMPNDEIVEPDSPIVQRYVAMYKKLTAENPGYPGTNIVGDYFKNGESSDAHLREQAPKLNGKAFLEEYRNRDQRITVGSGVINKENFFISDMWQVNPDTIVVPTLRLDHSSLFGSNVSGNIGVTHNVKHNTHRRFKANIGTGYTEPGMGELWYNWEMYASNPVGIGYAKLGWYWAGNPNLKPEKSLNFDMSIEGENKNTYARLGVFHNRIKDYMSVYYTGRLMDFAPYLSGEQKYQRAPDMIYSFKNIGKAEITGLEAEVRQKFGKHWSAKVGYTYLHAINKSDPSMPRQLLDKPVHKVDIGINYENEKSGWSGSLWGDYYINMLDSNTLVNGSNYWPDILEGNAAVFNKKAYERKTFGIWNFMIQKKIAKDSLVYFGINNIFNHRDDDRATQERVYRFGVNLKFGLNEATRERDFLPADKAEREAIDPVILKGFLNRPFDTEKKEGIDFIGDYRARWTAHNGTNRPQSRYRADTYVDTATKNMRDKSEHGFEQRIRVGADARLDKNTNLTVLASASGNSGVDTRSSEHTSKGLNHQRLEKADLTRRADKWDFSVGRLTEAMGVTGYWFGKEYDGARAVRTGKTSQIRIGFGDFKHSTGIDDSAYTHTIHGVIYRPPTVAELMGINRDEFPYDIENATNANPASQPSGSVTTPETGSPNQIYNDTYRGTGKPIYFYQRLKEIAEDPTLSPADKLAKENQVISELQQIVKAVYGEQVSNTYVPFRIAAENKVYYTAVDPDGNEVHMDAGMDYIDYLYNNDLKDDAEFKKLVNENFAFRLSDTGSLSDGKGYIGSRKEQIEAAYKKIAEYIIKAQLGESWYAGYTLKSIDSFKTTSSTWPYTAAPTNITETIYKGNYVDGYMGGPEYGWIMPKSQFEYLYNLERILRESESANKLPRESIGKVIGNLIRTEGNILQRDIVPHIGRAFFIQGKKQIGNRLGLQAWYLRSVGNENVSFINANRNGNEVHSFSVPANVIGVGAKYQFGHNATVSFDYGQNRTDLGRYLNGHTVYEHERGTADFTLLGHQDGGTPHFWALRFDIGRSDTDVPGSWNAFADYKYFQHGSFFGGTGAEGVPDRYLDGIRSFTVGAGYVPAKNFLVETFYTFDAKGINKRDTLYGPENFKLGNYTRIQATYKF